MMGRIIRSEDNLFEMPTGAYIRNKGYVYVNISNRYISPSEKRDKGSRGYTGHDSVCIGVLQDPADEKNRKFYANAAYRERFTGTGLPEPPRFSDSVSAGLVCWIAKEAEQSGLVEDLAEVFGEEDSQLVLDLCAYMLSRESAVMQHYPAWARDHMLFSEDIRSDTYIGQFLKTELTIPRINAFRDLWAVRNIGDGRIYLCYDSTNVNSQADGVFIVQKGHAKDDPTLKQVNTDYVVRQADGLPLTYLHSPGSVTDIAQAQEMIRFMERLQKISGKDISLCLICDRGYISGKNLRHMDRAGISYILMLRTTFGLYEELADAVIDEIKSYRNELQTGDDDEKYGLTKTCRMYEDGPECCAQILWSAEKYRSRRADTAREIADKRAAVEAFVEKSRGRDFEEKDLKWVPRYFRLLTEEGEPRTEERRKRGRGQGTKAVTIPTFRVVGYEDNEAEINRAYQKAGIVILITRDAMTVEETVQAYAKRDCVEKTFQALKSHLGMDKIGVTTEEAMHGKGLLWFTASILHALLFNGTEKLRITDRKHYTVPAMIDQLEAIKADRDLKTGKRRRRYKLTMRQAKILGAFGVTEDMIDERIADMDE